MITYIVGTIFAILGLVGYYANILPLLIIAVAFIVTEAIVELTKGTLNNINTYISALVIGLIVSLIFKLNIPLTLCVSLCYEELVMTGISLIFIIISLTKKQK